MEELTEKCSSSNCRQKEKDRIEENTQTCINGNQMLPNTYRVVCQTQRSVGTTYYS